MTTNNQYLKQMWITKCSPSQDEQGKVHTDNYYLKEICISCGYSYTGTVCNGKLYHDLAEYITSDTFTGNHFNNYYLRAMALEYVETLEHTNDNYLLSILAENINPTTTLRLEVSPSSVTYGGTVTLTATFLDENRDPLTNKTIYFYEGETSLGSQTTDNNGVATITKSNLGVGSHTIYASYNSDEYTSNNVSVTVNKITPTITLTVADDSVVYGEDIALSGVLSVGSGETVTIYDNDVVFGTATTTTDGAFSKTISQAGVGSHTYVAVYGGDTTHESVTSTIVPVTVSKKPTELEIDVPLVLVYDDSFNITGTLTDGTNAISGASVGLKVGDTIVESDTSDSSGNVAFTRTPVTMGTHTFQLVYNGDEHYLGASSTAVQRNITKETTVLSNLVPSASSTSMLISDSLTVSGTLTDNDTPDANPIANASIVVKESNTTLATFTTGNDGNFSGTISGATLGVGTHSLEIRYAETTNYATTYATKEVVVSAGTLSFSASPSILSYADSDSSTLTASLTSGGTGVSGQAVVFEKANATPTIDNLVVGSTPDTTAYAIGSKWKLTATGNSASQIDMYGSTGENYVRVKPISNGFKITARTMEELSGSVLYYDNGLFYTDTGDSLDTSSYLIITQIKFIVYTTITALTPILGVDVTDSSGVATGSYASAGVGDVSVRASVLGTVLSESFVVEDCIDYDSLTSSSGKWDFPSGTTVSYSSSGMYITGNAWKDGYFHNTYSKPYSVEFELADYSASGTNVFYMAVYFYNTSKTRLAQALCVNNGKTTIGSYSGTPSETSYTIPKGSIVRIDIESNSMKLYVDDVLKVSSTYDLASPSIVGLTTGTSRSTTYKDWKIKPL